MLHAVRALARNRPFQIVLGILLGVGFISFGASNFSPGGKPLVKMAGQDISARQFQVYYQNKLAENNLQNLSPADQKNLQLPQKFLQSLVLETLLLKMAQDMNLQIADSVVARAIKDNPIFKDPTTGQFSKDRYLATIKQNGISEGVIIEQVKKNLTLAWLKNYFAGLSFDVPALQPMWQGDKAQVLLDYLTLDVAHVGGKVAAPSEDDLKKYYGAHVAQYQLPNYRRFQVLTLSGDMLKTMASKKASVSDKEIKEAYEARRDEFQTQPGYQFEQLLFADKKSADDFYTRQASASTAAWDKQKTAGAKYNLINLNQSDLAAYGFEANDAVGKQSNVVETPFGFAMVRLVKKMGGGVRPLADVAPTLRAQLLGQKTNQIFNDTYRAVSDQLASGKNFNTVLKENNLNGAIVTTNFMDNQGRDKNGQKIKGQLYLDKMLEQGFAENIKHSPLLLTDNNNGKADIVAIGMIAEEATVLPPFDKIKNKVAQDWRQGEEEKILSAEKQKIDEQMANGKFDFAVYQASKQLPVARSAFLQKQILAEQPIFKQIDNSNLLQVLFTPAVAVLSNEAGEKKLLVIKHSAPPSKQTKLSAKDAADFTKQFQTAIGEGWLLDLYRTNRVNINWSQLDAIFSQ